eukprot:COSAG04_NODE_2695_length_3721_cov_2.697405_3_plen_578_part_00
MDPEVAPVVVVQGDELPPAAAAEQLPLIVESVLPGAVQVVQASLVDADEEEDVVVVPPQGPPLVRVASAPPAQALEPAEGRREHEGQPEHRRYRATQRVPITCASVLGSRVVGQLEEREVVRALEVREQEDSSGASVLRLRLDRGWVSATGPGRLAFRGREALLEPVVAEPFPLTLRSLFGEVMTIDVHADMTLHELKEAVFARQDEMHDFDSLRVLLDGDPLEDEEATAEELGLSEQTMTLMFSAQPPDEGRERRLAREEERRVAADERQAAEEAERARLARREALKVMALDWGKFCCAACAVTAVALAVVYATAGCGGLDCGANGQCVGGLASAACACEGNFIGELCQTECGCSGHGTQRSIESARAAGSCSAGSCTCTRNFIGQFCETECPIDCGAHGNLTGSIEAAREANSCSALSCACEGDHFGQLCEYQPWSSDSVPAQCAAGMGSHGVVYNGAAYRTLDDAPPEGGSYGDPNGGCQRIDYDWGRGDNEPNYLPLPPGYALAAPDADTIAVVAAHGWSTRCAVAADGTAWRSANYGSRAGGVCFSGHLASSGGSHTVTGCYWNSRVLARCP